MPLDLSNWMDLVKGAKHLNNLSIPGTHDSGSRTPASDASRLKTQTRSIGKQLNDGIRFLDIRAGYTNNEFALYHESVSLNLTFQSVLDTCTKFLANHPRETIIMSLKREDGAPSSGNTDGLTFQERFDKYVRESPTGLFYLQNALPTLHNARGKIVLFRRFALDRGTAPALHGINAYDDFPNDATGMIEGPPKLLIQDQFAQSGLRIRSRDEKFSAIEDLLNRASAAGNRDVLFVNFASAAGIFPDDYPGAVATDINPRLVTYFTQHTRGRFGIVVTDFQIATLNTLIVETNGLA